MNDKDTKSFGIMRFLSVLLVVPMCIVLAVEARAETMPKTPTAETTSSITAPETEETPTAAVSVEELRELQEQIDQISRKLTLVYVALGVGACGILVGLIAVILVLVRRPEEPEFNVAELATREAAEKLNLQNQNLKQEIAQHDRKLDALTRKQNERMEKMESELQQVLHRIEAKPQPAPATPQCAPPKRQENTAQQIGYLKLEYIPYAPNSSFLVKSDNAGAYVLFDDNTVEYVNAQPTTMNSLSGWMSEGVFYLFNPVLDGREADSDVCQKYAGFYQAISVRRRAKVKQINGGNYVCEEKGSVEMKKV